MDMEINNIYIYALKELKGFDEESIEKAILLAKNDVVETVEDFIDFVNFNIEDRKFPKLTKPFDERIIKEAVDKARKNEWKIVHSVCVGADNYPQKLLQTLVGPFLDFSYMGCIKNIERKSIMITGSSSITNNAKLTSTYLGKLLAANGYNILSSFSEGCEQSSIFGCIEASGISTFVLPHSVDNLSEIESNVIQGELEAGRSTLISVSNLLRANGGTIENAYRYLMALCDCIIVPQLSFNDDVMRFIINYYAAKKPVFFIDYKSGGAAEYDCPFFITTRGVKYISSKTALREIKDAIGGVAELII